MIGTVHPKTLWLEIEKLMEDGITEVGGTYMSLLQDQLIAYHEVGSQYICDPPPQDSDHDTLILVTNLPDAIANCKRYGFEVDGDGTAYYKLSPSSFVSMRQAEVNLILTDDRTFYCRFVTAANLCKKLNLHSKADRIEVHRSIIQGYELE